MVRPLAARVPAAVRTTAAAAVVPAVHKMAMGKTKIEKGIRRPAANYSVL
jgi:hypothetical protein